MVLVQFFDERALVAAVKNRRICHLQNANSAQIIAAFAVELGTRVEDVVVVDMLTVASIARDTYTAARVARLVLCLGTARRLH